jgi:quinoprotein glucose dehydrogenase
MTTGAERPRRAPRVFAALVLVFGLCLVLPGAVLLHLGGSPYYVLAGLGTVGCALLLWRGDGRSIALYAAVLLFTLVWAVWESDLDGWALLPRIDMPIVLGLWMLTPWGHAGLRGSSRIARWIVGFSAAAGIILFGAGILPPGYASVTEVPAAAEAMHPGDGDWLEYGRDKAGTRFSPLTQLTPRNVGKLQLAWSFRVGMPTGLLAGLEVSPLEVNDRLYLCAGNTDVIALDAESGRPIWRFEAKADPAGIFLGICRGVAYYRVPDGSGPCPERILSTTLDRRLVALNARDGSRCIDFGVNGEVNLDQGMGDITPGYYHVTSAPQVIRGKVVFGGWVTDGQYVGEPSGVVRAFDAITGKFAWAWDMGRPADNAEPAAGESYTRGTPNSWAPISADEELGLVYLPTGNATPDYVGQHRRPFDDAYSSSVVALDAQTGSVRWAYQTTRHDVWDYDVASQPTLLDLPNGRKALLQPTKRGELFLLDRRTGEPLAAVEERPVPQTDVPGERTSPTQPFSVGLPSFAGPAPSEARMWGVTPFDQLWCRIKFRQARFDGTMTPVGLNRPSVVYPGYAGGIDWGGVAVDPGRQIAIVNATHVLNYDQLISRDAAERLGIRPFSPSHQRDVGRAAAQAGTPFAALISPFLSPLIVPCTQPPFGTLSALDLNARRVLWSRPFGTARQSGPLLLHSHLPFTMGVPNFGGAVTTGAGLTFIGAAQDDYLRAIDTLTGRELWRYSLPAGGQATPITYWSARSGRQFVLIAAGGQPAIRTTPGDYVLAFALPEPAPN